MVFGSGTPLTVSFVAPPGSPSAWIRLVGDVDMMAEPALAEAAHRLGRLSVDLVDLDLAAVTFAGATLAHFLDALRDAHPDAALVLRHPSPMIRHILKVTGQDQFVVMHGDPVSSATSSAEHLEHLLPAGIADETTARPAFAPVPNEPEGGGAAGHSTAVARRSRWSATDYAAGVQPQVLDHDNGDARLPLLEPKVVDQRAYQE